MQAIVDALSEWLRQDWLQDASDVLDAVTALLELPAGHVRVPASVWSLATLCSTSGCLSAPACRMAAAAIRSGASILGYLTHCMAQLYCEASTPRAHEIHTSSIKKQQARIERAAAETC